MNIALIGCGTMGAALARHLAKHSVLSLCDRNPEKGKKLAKEIGALWVDTAHEAVLGADFVILAVKPKDFLALAEKLPIKQTQTVFSVLSGTTLAALKKAFPLAAARIRMMPNLALTVGKGIIGFSEEGNLESERKKEIDALFSSLGLLLWIPENKMEAFASFAASSPAFGFVVLEAMMEGGIHLGFTVAESRKIVLEVFEGCVALLKATHHHPAELKNMISSPGGTTIAGLRELEAAGIRMALMNALDASWKRGIEVSLDHK